jgi:hypothetical protein
MKFINLSHDSAGLYCPLKINRLLHFFFATLVHSINNNFISDKPNATQKRGAISLYL